MPTWKRRAAEREAASYASLQYADYPVETAPAPAPEPEPQPAFPAKIVTWPAAPLSEAATADQAPDRDAQAVTGAEAAPALTEQDEPAAEPAL
jgi:hypothetical protein